MKNRGFTLVEGLVVLGIICLIFAIVLGGLGGEETYQYKEVKITETMYQLPLVFGNHWDDALAEFNKRHPELEIVTSDHASANTYDKKVVVIVRKLQK